VEQQEHRLVLYVGHPVSGDVDGNIKRALRWLKWLRHRDPDNTYIMPWIAALQSGEDDNDPVARERGLVDCETAAAKCDGIILVGGRVSSGMAREREAVIKAGGHVFDYTRLGDEAPGLHERFDVGGDA
jgi:hypothetical protein